MNKQQKPERTIQLEENKMLFAAKREEVLKINEKGIVLSISYPIYHLTAKEKIEAFFLANPTLEAYKQKACSDNEDREYDLVHEPLRLCSWGCDDEQPNLIYVFEGVVTGNVFLIPARVMLCEISTIKVMKTSSAYFVETPKIKRKIMQEIREDNERLAQIAAENKGVVKIIPAPFE